MAYMQQMKYHTWVHNDPAEVSAAAPRGIAGELVGLEAACLVLNHYTEAYLKRAGAGVGFHTCMCA